MFKCPDFKSLLPGRPCRCPPDQSLADPHSYPGSRLIMFLSSILFARMLTPCHTAAQSRPAWCQASRQSRSPPRRGDQARHSPPYKYRRHTLLLLCRPEGTVHYCQVLLHVLIGARTCNLISPKDDIIGQSLAISAGVLTVPPDLALTPGTGLAPPALHPDREARITHWTWGGGAGCRCCGCCYCCCCCCCD